VNNRNIKILAGLGAVALGAALFPNPASAFNVQADGSDPFTVSATTNVNNIMDVAPTTLQFGTFGAVKDPGVNVATATLSPAGVFSTSTTGGLAKIIDANLADHSPSTVTIAAQPSTQLYASYSAVVDVAGTITPANVFTVQTLVDDLGTVVGGITNGGMTAPGVFVEGSAATDNTGALVFHIGGSLVEQAGTTYSSEPYAGSFSLTMSY
jgi:hypothetical protein